MSLTSTSSPLFRRPLHMAERNGGSGDKNEFLAKKIHITGGVGGGQADVGEYGDFMGTLQQISALVLGEMWGRRVLNALLSGRMWGLRFCSTERILGTIDCSLDRRQDGGGEEENML